MSIMKLGAWAVPAVSRWSTAVEVAREMARYGVDTVIVTDNDCPIGALTERDLVRCVILRGYSPSESLAGDLLACVVRNLLPEREVPAFNDDGECTGVVPFAELCRDAPCEEFQAGLTTPISNDWQSFE